MERKLASVQVVHDILPIEGADRIELAKVLGWQCVVRKGEFHKGDIGIYFEIDSFLPMDDRYGFLDTTKSDIMGEGHRIRTVKMRGQISQGLLLPLDMFPEIPDDVRRVGTDLTELLSVRKWEEEERATDSGTIIGQLPPGIPKTNEIRVQNAPELIQELGKQPCYITTKMDGSSHSIELDADNVFHVTGHNYEYKDDGKSGFYNYVNKHGIKEKLERFKESHPKISDIVMQGEFCAPGIQGNRVKLKAPEWYVFTVMVNGERVSLDDMVDVAMDVGVKIVQVEELVYNFAERYPTVDAVLERADKSTYTTPKGGKTKAEGIVIRPLRPVYSETIGGYLSMKAVSNKYLLSKK